jgi:hypothetical protein
MPLDGRAEAIAIGVVFPALWWFHPRFLRTRTARALVVALVAWKALTAAALVADGWCVRFQPSVPLVKDAAGAPHSWDVRADWRAPNPACSAILTRSYRRLNEFPAWFLNLPPPDDNLPAAADRPPGAVVRMTVSGFIHPRQAGVLRIESGPGNTPDVLVEGARVSGADASGVEATVTPGIHRVVIDVTLTGDRWRFATLWNDALPWPGMVATVNRPSVLDFVFRPWGAWITALLAAGFIGAWIASALARAGDPIVVAWTIGTSACIAWLASAGRFDLAGWAVAGLGFAAALPIRTRLRNTFGAFLLIGVPWLTLIVAASAPSIGRFTLYTAGDDYWTFQRFAYRIFMQGYWLEGGQRTFWFQPLYRWIAGALHLVFGDSSVGEWYWDGACILAMTLFGFHATKRFAGFRWGLAAGITTLAVVVLGPGWAFVGRGLSEITSAGFAYLAALIACRSRPRHWRIAIVAGVLASLAFYTRMNNLPLAVAAAAFALPTIPPVRTAFPAAFRRSLVPWGSAILVVSVLGLGLLLFAWRTWHYTGVFSVFHGTPRAALSIWQPGMSVWTWLERMTGSLMMVLTMHDPPAFDPLAIPLLLGFIVSLLALLRFPRLRNLPPGPVLFCLGAVSGSLIARGSAYPGRFSIHVIGVTSTVFACTAALLWQTLIRLRSHDTSA